MSEFNNLVMSLEGVTSETVNNRSILKATYHCHVHSGGIRRDPFKICLSQSPRFALGENNFDIEVIDDCVMKDYGIAISCKLKGKRMLLIGDALIRVSDYMGRNAIRNEFPILIVIREDEQEKSPDTSSESAPTEESRENHDNNKIDPEEYVRLRKEWQGKEISNLKTGNKYNVLGILPVKVNGQWDFVTTYSPVVPGDFPAFGRFIPDLEANFKVDEPTTQE